MAPSFSEKQSILSYKRMRPFLFAFERKTISKKKWHQLSTPTPAKCCHLIFKALMFEYFSFTSHHETK